MVHLTAAELDWAVHVKGGREAADLIAKRHNMKNMGEIIADTNYYLLRTKDNARRKRSVSDLEDVFSSEKDVDWAEYQSGKERVKRDALSIEDDIHKPCPSICTSQSTQSTPSTTTDLKKTTKAEAADREERGYPSNNEYQHMFGRRLVDNLLPRRLLSEVNDPLWSDMWYVNRRNSLTMNVQGAWNFGMTGMGVAVTILDDGIEKDHPDLIRNYDPLSSTDINDGDSDPNPRYDFSDSNRHGTRCAGQVAATPNNSLCAIGIAFNAQIGGIRMLDGQVSDAVEARKVVVFQPGAHPHLLFLVGS